MMGAIYGATMFIGVTNCSAVQPFVDVGRSAFYREKAAGMYSPVVYALAQVSNMLQKIFMKHACSIHI